MSEDATIQATFRGELGHFTLDAAFTVPATGVTALFGPSGCGKTTVLRCIAGLHRVANGICVVGDEVWQNRTSFLPPHRRPIGYVFQEASLFPHLSVTGNLLYGVPGRRTPPQAGGHEFDEVVELLGLSHLLDRAPRHLSGGERQRVAIGRALLSRPKLLLMDEPLSALDRPTRAEILPFLQRLHAALAMPILYVSHDMAEVEQLADTLVLMGAGRVRASGPLSILQTDPALPFAAAREAVVSLDALVESHADVDGLLTLAVGDARFIVPGGPQPPGTRRRLRVAAGDVSLARFAQASTILNVIPVRIGAATPVGAYEMLATLDLTAAAAEGPRLLARVTLRSWNQLGLVVGDLVVAQIKSVALAAPDAPDT